MTIDMNQEYSQGETIIAKVSGSFIDPLLEENVFFYRSYVRIPMDYDVIKIGNNYYIKVSLIGKSENNYSIQIKNVRYYDSGLLSTKTVIKNFTINNSTADFAIDPGFVSSSNDFYIKLQNLKDASLDINIKGFTGISNQNSVILGPSETYFLNFQINPLTTLTLGVIELNSGNLKYSIPTYLIYVPIPPAPEQPFCGDSKITSGETCDGTNWGSIKNCSNFGFNNGTLSCNPPGSQSQCLIDTSNCFNTPTSPLPPPLPPPNLPTECNSTNPCPKDYFCLNGDCIQNISEDEEPFCGDGNINSGESCDGTNWGAIKNCKNMGFDGGALRCTNCDFNTTDCFNDVIPKDEGCVYDRDCPTDQICEDKECVSEECDIKSECDKNQKCEFNRCIDNECAVDKDCKNENLTCRDGSCVEKDCTIDYNCAYGYKCDNGKCVKKGCIISYDCVYGMVCEDFICKIRIKNECTNTDRKNCSKDQVCVRGNCLNQSRVSGDIKDIQTCLEMGGKTCSDSTKCDGQTQKISEVVCCFAICVENKSSTGKIIGWGLLVTIFVIILWFFLKARRRTRY